MFMPENASICTQNPIRCRSIRDFPYTTLVRYDCAMISRFTGGGAAISVDGGGADTLFGDQWGRLLEYV